MSKSTGFLFFTIPSSLEEPWEDSINSFFNEVDANLFSAVTDRNLIVTGGGTVTFDAGSGELTWTDPFVLINFVTGFYQYVVDPSTTSPAGPATVLNPGDFLFSRQVRGLEEITGNIKLDPIVATKLLTSPRKEFHIDTVICFRWNNTIIFHGGQVLPSGVPTPVLIAPPAAVPVFNYPVFLQTQFCNEDLALAGEPSGIDPVTMKTGEYTGDGTSDRVITTGLVGTLRYVRVFRTDFTDTGVYKTNLMTAKETKSEDGNVFNGIAFLGSDFTVDNLPSMNGTGFVYRWVAFGTP
jgi:hypothetical protein